MIDELTTNKKRTYKNKKYKLVIEYIPVKSSLA